MRAFITLTSIFSTAAAVAALAVPAAPDPLSVVPIPISQCDTGDAHCCNSIEPAKSPMVATLLGLLGVVVQGVDVQVGLGCNEPSFLILAS